MNDAAPRLGSKIRSLRRRESLTQVELAHRLGISASYLNLIEHNRRPLGAALLVKVAGIFGMEARALASEDERQLVADLLEVFGDRLFDGLPLPPAELRELAVAWPAVGRAVAVLYHAYQSARRSADSLAAKVTDGGELQGLVGHAFPSEEVNDLIQRHLNHFPALEDGAERLWRDAALDPEDLARGLGRHLERRHGTEVRIEKVGAMGGATRRYDPHARRLAISEALPPGSRSFQMAHQIALIDPSCSQALDRIARDAQLTSAESRALCRVALANYFAAAVVMPYQRFLEAARAERYDVELLGHRFHASFEQICHRLTSLRRPGAEGIPFHFIRIDIAGNISKRFSASGIRFARFAAACPRWNVHASFLTPGIIRVQLSQMPDGSTYFCIARTLRRNRRFHAPHAVQAVGLGCDARHARDLVYADGVDLDNRRATVPVGVTCRLCERSDCEQRAFPSLRHRLQIDENLRGVSFYAPVSTR